jgi:hypothetical protein
MGLRFSLVIYLNSFAYLHNMGNPFLLQACLRLEKIPRKLVLGKKYKFSKNQHRLYQINVPMDLRTRDWKFHARVIITEFTIGKNKTTGTFIPVRLFSLKERDIITKTFVSDEEVKLVKMKLTE